MKTFTAKVLAVVLIELTALNTKAQCSLDLGSVIPVSSIAPKPVGFSFAFLSPSLIKKSETERNSFKPEIRLGGNFYLASLDQHSIENVPVVSPGFGLARVGIGSRMMGYNFVSRVEFPFNKYVIPYVDLFAGFRDSYVELNVMPYTPGQRSGSQTTGNFSYINYGMTGGLKFRMAENIYADVSLVYTSTFDQGKIVDIRSARVEDNDLVMDRKDSPMEMYMIKTGVVFMISDLNGGNSGYYRHGYCNWNWGNCLGGICRIAGSAARVAVKIK